MSVTAADVGTVVAAIIILRAQMRAKGIRPPAMSVITNVGANGGAL